MDDKERSKLKREAAWGEVLNLAEGSEFFVGVTKYIHIRMAQLQGEGFHGEPEDLKETRGRYDELGLIRHWLEKGKEDGIEAQKRLSKE